MPNLKFVALPVPEIIGGTQKNLGSPCMVPQSISRLVLYYTICRIADMSEEFNLTLTAKNPSVNF